MHVHCSDPPPPAVSKPSLLAEDDLHIITNTHTGPAGASCKPHCTHLPKPEEQDLFGLKIAFSHMSKGAGAALHVLGSQGGQSPALPRAAGALCCHKEI